MAEGIDATRVHLVGNTMIDSLVLFEDRFRAMGVAREMGLTPGGYVLVTLHRPSLVDGDALGLVLRELEAVASELPVVFPVHPRTRLRIDESSYPRIRFLPPLGYLEFLSLECDAGAVLTDSGGVQEETTYLGVPCFTLREHDGAARHDQGGDQHAARPRAGAYRGDPGPPSGSAGVECAATAPVGRSGVCPHRRRGRGAPRYRRSRQRPGETS